MLHRRFLSTPSGWRATAIRGFKADGGGYFYPRPPGGGRHLSGGSSSLIIGHFYPRPPGGGRLQSFLGRAASADFYPRPPGGGRLSPYFAQAPTALISIHALRVEGDRAADREYDYPSDDFYPRPPGGGRLSGTVTNEGGLGFLSTPSGWRATAKTDKVFVCFCAKGRRICLFKTRKEKNLPVAF